MPVSIEWTVSRAPAHEGADRTSTPPPMGKAGDYRKEQQAYHHYKAVQQLEVYITPERDHTTPNTEKEYRVEYEKPTVRAEHLSYQMLPEAIQA
jgi:hypothetical protein